MDRNEAMQELEKALKDAPKGEKPVLKRFGMILTEYAECELGFSMNSLNQRLKVLEQKIDFFYRPRNCPKCGSDYLLKVISPRQDRGKTFCKKCGLVI